MIFFNVTDDYFEWNEGHGCKTWTKDLRKIV